MHRLPITPARISFDAGSAPFALDYADVYHAIDGGPAQTQHVFLAGNDLPRRWRGRECFAILETGFGLGLNFACTASEFLADPRATGRLHYVAVEKHPPLAGDLARAHARWPQFAALFAELRLAWPPALRGFHRLAFADERVVLTLLFGEAADMLGELDAACIDACYLDGFSPQKNPQIWSAAVFAQIDRVCRPEATAATWSIAACVRAGLEAAGFALERRAGFARKRDMLAARRASTAHAGPATGARRAVVVGAGMAGCWTAYALARRGWQVDVVERRAAPAAEASGNPVGVLLPALNLADNANARLARAAFLHASRTLHRAGPAHGFFARTGSLQIALERLSALAPRRAGRRRTREEHALRMREIITRHDFPDDFVRWVDAEEGSHLAGATVGGPGWWIPAGGWVRPDAMSRYLLSAGGRGVHARYDTNVHGIRPGSRGWQIVDAAGAAIAEAPTLVLANAHAATALGLAGLPRLIAVRGQISHLPPSATADLHCVVCGDGYVAPHPEGGWCIGATFEPGSTALDLRLEDHEQNLRRALRMLPGFAQGVQASALSGRVALRTTTADRLPACGELAPSASDASAPGGVHLFAGLGARGLIWAPLCAEVLASRLAGEPNPVEASLVAALNPGRDVPVP